MTNGGRNVTNVDIYDRLERLRLEVTKKIDDSSRDHKEELGDLRRQFETLEAGRLTRLEAQMNKFEIDQVKKDGALAQNQAVLSTKVLVVAGIGIAIFNALLYGLFTKVFK